MKLAAFLPALALLCVGAQASPYAWSCNSGKCLRKLKSELAPGTGVPQDICKLNCDALGSLWPKPTGATSLGRQLVSLYPSKITVDVTGMPQPVRQMATEAFAIFKTYFRAPPSESDEETLKHSLRVILKATSDTTHIGLETDESYTLSVTTAVESGNTIVTATIEAATYFGARHGLETLSQVIAYDVDNNILQAIGTVSVVDKPVFPYRGVMLDTSRNFYTIPVLKRLIDGMSYNKLSVFHWHIIDSYAFPMEVTRRPKMMEYGAYSDEKIYTKAAIADLVKYARQRGIKVIPELDQPAHSGYGYNWGEEDNLGKLVVCVESEPWYNFCVQPPCGQLNIVNDNVLDVVGDIFKDMFEVFDKDIFHMGGDEVDFRCYNDTTEITEWMGRNNIPLDEAGFFELWGRWQEKLLNKMHEVTESKDTHAILWTSGLTHPERIEQYLDKSKYIIQIWTDSKDEMINGVLEKGYRVFFSNVDALYLDCGFQAWLGNGHNWCAPIKGWQVIYDNDPAKIYGQWVNESDAERAIQEGQIIGSETPLWSEQADEMALESRVWPRAAAHAERLWSHPKNNHSEAEIRMVTNRNRMVGRGISADRMQPEFCTMYEGKCYAPAPAKQGAGSIHISTMLFGAVFVLAIQAISKFF